MLVSSEKNETRVAILESKKVTQLYFDRKHKRSLVGNIYLGRVQNVLPSLDAAFVDIGESKNAFLYVGEVSYDSDLEDRDDIPRKIHHILKPNQMLLVQVTKDPMKGKGARLTTFISIPGRYLVLAPFNDGIGVSRKLNREEREYLRNLVSDIKPVDCGLIVRTAAKEAGKSKLKRELKQLIKIWHEIQRRAAGLTSPGLVYQEYSIVIRLLRDIFSEDFSAIYVDKKEIKKEILRYLKSIGSKFNNVIVFHGEDSLFDAFNVDRVIERALERRVWLKSGGFIVIDYGEALTSIDVNTGKYTSAKSSEDAILKTNLEAAEEIADQLKLRDIGGIIVIDFIDMHREEDRKKVFERFKQCLESDRTKTEVLPFSKLGLLEMTRKNVSDGILGTLCKPCPTCNGIGYIKSEETVSLEVERKIKKLAKESTARGFLIKLNPAIASLVIGQGGKNLKHLEGVTRKYIAIKSDESLPMDGFVVAAEGSVEEIKEAAKPFRVGDVLELTVEDGYSHNKVDGLSRIEGYVIQIIGGRKYLGKRVKAEIKSVSKTSAVAQIIQ